MLKIDQTAQPSNHRNSLCFVFEGFVVFDNIFAQNGLWQQAFNQHLPSVPIIARYNEVAPFSDEQFFLGLLSRSSCRSCWG